MDEFLGVFRALSPALGGAGAIAFASILYFHSRRAQEIEGWMRLANEANDRRIIAEQRADQFAHERNEAREQLGELRGQLRQVLAELELVRTEVRELKERLQ